jgi:hypothetical protein
VWQGKIHYRQKLPALWSIGTGFKDCLINPWLRHWYCHCLGHNFWAHSSGVVEGWLLSLHSSSPSLPSHLCATFEASD